jgi:hypothetical protein
MINILIREISHLLEQMVKIAAVAASPLMYNKIKKKINGSGR